MTRDQIAAKVRENLNDAGVTFYTADDINDSIQDAYDEVAVFTGCIQKTATVAFISEKSHYHLLSLIPDFYAIVAAYNNNTNKWLDPTKYNDLDRVRIDWEVWEGQPQFFAPRNHKYVTFVPRLVNATGNMTVYYRAQANTLIGSDTPLIHFEEVVLLEWYATADLLDQAEMYKKSADYWKDYLDKLLAYKKRVATLAMSDYAPGV